MRVIIVKSNHTSINPQMEGEGKQRKDKSWEVTFANLPSTLPGKEGQRVQDVTIWFPESFVKAL